MKNIYTTTLLCYFFLMSSCSQELVLGKLYQTRHGSSFIFYPDSTFDYEYNGWCKKKSSGTWSQNKKLIYLSTGIQAEKIPIEYTKEIGDNSDISIINVTVNVPNKNQRDYICFPFINGQPYIQYPERGTFAFRSKKPIDSLCFTVAKMPLLIAGFLNPSSCFNDVKTEKIAPKLSIGENLNVTINIVDTLFSYKVFQNIELKIRKNKLIFEEEKEKVIIKEEKKKYKLCLKRE